MKVCIPDPKTSIGTLDKTDHRSQPHPVSVYTKVEDRWRDLRKSSPVGALFASLAHADVSLLDMAREAFRIEERARGPVFFEFPV